MSLDDKAQQREPVLRLVLLQTVVDWVQTSHATFPEHDHHCGGKDPCSCGYAAAQIALAELDRLDTE